MAITPRSLVLNPALLFIASLTILALAAVFLTSLGTYGADRLSYWESVRDDCAPQQSDASAWTESTWEAHVDCFLDARRFTEAYAAANEGVRYHPRSESLLNLRGFAAARNGLHAVAAYDFRQGLRVTGSPSGIFENNLAWTMLWQLDRLEPQSAAHVLREARALYEASLTKQLTCPRVHTALYVEYAIASLEASTSPRGAQSPVARDARARYARLRDPYGACFQLLDHGDELVVEELLSAAVIDRQMRQLAGHHSPPADVGLFRRAAERGAELGVPVDAAFCDRTHPTAPAAAACRDLLR